ncbi:MAG: sulfatase [Verrucomicrobiota bacterium]
MLTTTFHKLAMVLVALMCAALPANAETKRPNILFAIADDMSHASAYGYQFLDTPNFDRLADEGILFTRTHTPSSKCAPARSCIITGRNPWQLEEAANHWPTFPKKFKSVVEVLGENGYFTGYTGKGWGPGDAQGRDLTGKQFNKNRKEPPPTTGASRVDHPTNFIDFLDAKPADQPFFFWFGSYDPHRGYEYQSGVKSGKKFEDLDFLPKFWGDDEGVKHDILDYAVEVEIFDRELGDFLNILKERGELENTLIIVTSDNGMPFPRYKGQPYQLSTWLPLAVKWPAKLKNPGRVTDDFISVIDFAPTFLDAAGISEEQSGMQTIEGRSMLDLVADEPKHDRSMILTGRERFDLGRRVDGMDLSYPVRSIIRGNYIYMHNFEPDRIPGQMDTDGSPTRTYVNSLGTDSMQWKVAFGIRPQEELYDLEKDPESIHNLADNPEYADLIEELKDEMFAALKEQGDPRMSGQGHLFDEYQYYHPPHKYETTLGKLREAHGDIIEVKPNSKDQVLRMRTGFRFFIDHQLMVSSDKENWTPFGDPIPSTGKTETITAPSKDTTTYYRWEFSRTPGK